MVALRAIILVVLAAWLPVLSYAASGCTAMWATLSASQQIAYYNYSSGTAAKWTVLPFTLTGSNANALAGDANTGLLWYYDRTGTKLYSVNLNTYAVSAGVSLSTAAPAAAGNGNIIGATFDASGNMYLLASTGANGSYYLSQVTNPATGTNGAWTTVTYAVGGGIPASGGSGDIAYDQSGQAWLATNTNPTALYPLTLSTAKVGTSVTYAIGALSIAGVAVDPVSGAMFIGGTTNGSITYKITSGTANSQVLTDAGTDAVTDMGNCVTAPAAPSVSKTFSPTYQPLSGATTTLYISITNSNTVPIWLVSTFTDTLPTGMTVAATSNLSTGACASTGTTVTNVITATAGQSTMTFASGGRIPAGGCTISFSVTAAAQANPYTNTLAVGSLATTAGSNAAAASASYQVGTDFAAAKVQGLGTAGPYTSAAQTTPGGQTMQYVLTVSNSSTGGTGSATFTDTMPALMTPVLTITSGLSGGGSCAIGTATVAGATQITGTVTNATAGSVCTVTVTTKVSATQTVATSVTNTLTVAPVSTTSDTNAANNSAAVSTSVGPTALLTVVKSNGTTTVTAGSTTSYTVTVANLGPAAAGGTTLVDPAVTGLSCTSVTCAVAAGTATCPASPTVAALQGAGLSIPTFNASSTVTFVVTCGVTASGQ